MYRYLHNMNMNITSLFIILMIVKLKLSDTIVCILHFYNII